MNTNRIHKFVLFLSILVTAFGCNANEVSGKHANRDGDCPINMSFVPSQTTYIGRLSHGEASLCEKGNCKTVDKNTIINNPRIKIVISSPICVDMFEVTQNDYEKIMNSNPSHYNHCGSQCPVDSVTWNDAKLYCEKGGKRLLTEIEWEVAARGGTEGMNYYWGDEVDNDYLWWSKNTYPKGLTGGFTQQVGLKKPNQYMLYDMIGNVSEWVYDCYDDNFYRKLNQKDANIDPVNDIQDCTNRVIRGGNKSSGRVELKVFWRGRLPHNEKMNSLGFRCAKNIVK